MSQRNMENLLLAEMKRAVEIMESKDGIRRYIKGQYGIETDRDVVELLHLFKSIRRHTIALEKIIKGQNPHDES